jgi:hypothetical protein
MKTWKFTVFVVIVVAFGLCFTACDNGTSPVTKPDTVATPMATPAAGTYAAAQSVTLACSTAGAKIYYTTDGSAPTAKSTLYSNPVALSVTTTLKAIAVKQGMTDSGILSALYIINIIIPAPNQTPAADDYHIGNLTQMVGNITAVTITPKADKSGGAVTVYYDGSTTLPTTAGTYTVTFNVAAADGWNEASGLSAGTLTINPGIPVAADYTIEGLEHVYNGSPKTVTITAKEGKSPGTITNIKYGGNAAAPSALGGYAITFDVAAALPNWNAASNLDGGIMTINATYTVTQIGGAADVASTTGLKFEFSTPIDSLNVTAADLTVGGAAVKGSAVFTGSGTSWTLSPITAVSVGNATVSFAMPGIESQAKSVEVYALTGTIFISLTQIADAASGITIDIPVLHRFNGDISSAVLTLTNAGQYDDGSISWRVNGTEIGTGASVTLNAEHSANKTFGTHYLTINVKKSGVSYNKTIPFTVEY